MTSADVAEPVVCVETLLPCLAFVVPAVPEPETADAEPVEALASTAWSQEVIEGTIVGDLQTSSPAWPPAFRPSASSCTAKDGAA